MVVVLGLLVLLFVLWRHARRVRQAKLAGLTYSKPVFTIGPPTRYSTRSKDHRL